MARAAARYVFVALLALLATHGVVPSVRLQSVAEIVWCSRSEQHAARELPSNVRHPRRADRVRRAYQSRTRPEPDASVLFQRPPPHSFLLS